MTTVKITELTNIGANLATSTLVPVVNMAGTPTTQKTTVGNIANLILEGAGVDYPEASVALLAQTVSNAAQPNITSTGTLTGLTVSGNTNLGAVANVRITGGTSGQVLSTDGAGNLSWASDATTYGNSNVATYLASYGSNTITTTGNVSVGNIIGNGQALTGIVGANVSGFVPNANVANTAYAVAAANVSGLGNIAVSNYDGNASNVLHGDGTWSADTTTYGNSNVAAYLPTFSGNIGANVVSANLFVGSGANLTNLAGGNVVGAVPYATTANLVAGANVSGQVNYASIANSVAGVNVSGQVNFAATANSVAAANVSGLGNIATINLDGNISNALLGNGAWGPVEVNVNSIYNGTSSVQIPSANSNVSINVGSNTWSFTTDGDIHLPGNSYLLTSGEVGFLVAANEVFEITTSNSANYSWLFNPDGSLLVPEQLSGRTSIFSRDSNANTTSFVSFPTASSSNLTLGTNDIHNVVINTDHSNANLRWVFDNTGNLSVPVNINFNGGGLQQVVNEDFYVRASDNEADGWSIYNVVDDGAGNTLTQTRLAYNDFTVRTNAQGNSYTWAFRDSGVLDLPGDIYGNVGGNLTIKIGDQSGSNTFIDLQTRSYVGDALISNIHIGDPNVTISTSNAAYTWTFGNTGLLTFPGTPRIDTSTNNFEVQAAQAVNFEANTVVNIYTDSGNNAFQWQFGDDGTLTVPFEGIIQSINDTVILQSVDANSNTYSARLGTNGGLYFATTTYPQGWLNIENNSGNANITAAGGTAGGAGKHIYINAGAADQTDFYTTAGGNINITGGLGASNDGGGGGPGGSINITAGNSADPSGFSGSINITTGSNVWTFNNAGQITLPGNQGYIGPTVAGNPDLRIYNDQSSGLVRLGWQPGAVLTPGANVASNVTLDSSGFTVTTTSDSFTTTKDWVFGTGGNLAVPGSINFSNSTLAYMTTGANNYINLNNDGGMDLSCNTEVKITTNYGDAPNRAYSYFYANGNFATGSIVSSGNISGGNISTTGNISGNTNGYTIGYLNIPQVAASNTTLALGDAGKHYYSTTAGNFTLTVPNNSSAAFATGTAISIVVQAAGNILVNAASGVTLYMAGNSTAANRVVGGYGMATLMKVASDTWFINGTGVS